jgi:hypothetical protein
LDSSILEHNKASGMTSPRPQSSRSAALIIGASQVMVYLYLLLISVVLYTFLHEGGHALVGVFSGGKITGFSINFLDLSAHVDLDGTFGVPQTILLNISGAILPLLVWSIFVLLTPVQVNPNLQLFKFTSGVIPISSLLAWIVIPILVMMGQSPADDSTNFLRNTQLYPPVVSGGALLLMTGGFTIMLKRLGGWQGLVKRLRGDMQNFGSPPARRTLLALTGVLATVVLASIALNGGTLEKNHMVLPAGYAAAGSVDLRNGKVQDTIVYQFSLKQATRVSLYFIFPNLASGPAEITLEGPGAFRNVFFKAGASFKGGGSVNPTDLALDAGDYQIRMTFPQMNGQVVIGIRPAS